MKIFTLYHNSSQAPPLPESCTVFFSVSLPRQLFVSPVHFPFTGPFPIHRSISNSPVHFPFNLITLKLLLYKVDWRTASIMDDFSFENFGKEDKELLGTATVVNPHKRFKTDDSTDNSPNAVLSDQQDVVPKESSNDNVDGIDAEKLERIATIDKSTVPSKNRVMESNQNEEASDSDDDVNQILGQHTSMLTDAQKKTWAAVQSNTQSYFQGMKETICENDKQSIKELDGRIERLATFIRRIKDGDTVITYCDDPKVNFAVHTIRTSTWGPDTPSIIFCALANDFLLTMHRSAWNSSCCRFIGFNRSSKKPLRDILSTIHMKDGVSFTPYIAPGRPVGRTSQYNIRIKNNLTLEIYDFFKISINTQSGYTSTTLTPEESTATYSLDAILAALVEILENQRLELHDNAAPVNIGHAIHSTSSIPFDLEESCALPVMRTTYHKNRIQTVAPQVNLYHQSVSVNQQDKGTLPGSATRETDLQSRLRAIPTPLFKTKVYYKAVMNGTLKCFKCHCRDGEWVGELVDKVKDGTPVFARSRSYTVSIRDDGAVSISIFFGEMLDLSGIAK